MNIPSTSVLLDAFARMTRPHDVRPAPPPTAAERPDTPASSTASRTEIRQAVSQLEEGEATSQEFQHPPGNGPFRRGILVDLRI